MIKLLLCPIYNLHINQYLLKYVKAVISKDKATLLPYWSNTSSNDIIRELIFTGGEETRATLQELMNGKSVKKPIYEDITYRNVDINSDYIWSFLLHTGYLKPKRVYMNGVQKYFEAVIPNLEIVTVYENTFRHWFDESIRKTDKSILLEAVLEGDTETFQAEVNRCLQRSISYHDGYNRGCWINCKTKFRKGKACGEKCC